MLPIGSYSIESEANTPRNTRLSLAVKVAGVIGVCIPVALAFLYVNRFGVNVPYHDQWAEFPLFNRLFHDKLSFEILFSLHNEHRIFFPRLVMLGLGMLTAYNTVAEMYFIQVCAVLSLVIFWLAFLGSWGAAARYRVLLFIPVAFMLFSLRQYSSMLQGIQIVVAMTQTCAVLAFLCVYICRSERFIKVALPVAIVSATVASFSFLQGLFVWPVGLAQLLITPVRRPVKRVLVAVWAVFGVVEWALYFYGFSSNGGRSMTYFLTAPVEAVQYLTTLAGGSILWRPEAAMLAGAALLGLVLYCILASFRGGKLGEYSFWLAVLGFAGLFMLAAMAGRLEDGVQQAIASRYVNFTILLPISLYVILVKLAFERRVFLPKVALVALSALIVLSLPVSYLNGLQSGASTKVSREMDAYILANYESQPGEILATLIPQFDAAEGNEEKLSNLISSAKIRAGILDRLDYGVFAGGSKQWKPLPETSDLTPIDSSTAANITRINGKKVTGSGDAVPLPPGEVVIDVMGWAVDTEAKASAGGVYVEVGDERFPASYGLQAAGLVDALGEPGYSDSGFEAKVSVLDVEPGTHELSLVVLSQDRNSYYTVPGVATIRVREG
jgi:hypothetical protein